MIATDDLVFVHLHKSGGTFINELLLRCAPNARRLGYHLPYRQAPAEVRHLPVLGTLRDPLGYYVSWYHFQKGMKRPNILFLLCSKSGTLGFEATIRNLLYLESDDQKLLRLEEAVPDHFQQHGINLTKSCIQELRNCKTGFYSFLVNRMYDRAHDLRLVRTERIQSDLAYALQHTSIPQIVVERFLSCVPPQNTSRYDRSKNYYSSALRTAVEQRDNSTYFRLKKFDVASGLPSR